MTRVGGYVYRLYTYLTLGESFCWWWVFGNYTIPIDRSASSSQKEICVEVKYVCVQFI